MNKKQILSAAVLLGMSATAAFAQETDSQWFGGVKAGVQLTPTNYDALRLLTPTVGVELGYMIAPQFGLRLDVMGLSSKTAFRSVDKTMDFKFFTTDLDLLFNVTNMFLDQPHKFDFTLVAGAGWNHSWDTKDAGLYPYADRNYPAHDDLNSVNLRLGAIGTYNINETWGLNLEADANRLRDQFNSKYNNSCDWQLTTMLGLAYHFGNKKSAPAKEELAPAPVVEQKPAPVVEEKPAPVVEEKPVVKEEPKPVVKEEPKPVVKEETKPAVVTKAPEELRIEIFYNLADASVLSSEDAKLQEIKDFMKDHKIGSVLVSGYADKGTGNAEINQKYSEQRVANVVNKLKKTYGIDAKAITSKAYGDSVQPYAENDKNRLVIIEVKEAK